MGKKTRLAAKGQSLKMRRLELGYTQKEFAKAIGVSQQHLSLIETGGSGASERIAMSIAQRLRCDVGAVFDVVVPYDGELPQRTMETTRDEETSYVTNESRT